MKKYLVLLLIVSTIGNLHAQKPVDWKESLVIKAILTKAGDAVGLPIGLSHCVAYAESRFIPTARSKVVNRYRSDGLMQIHRKYLYGENGMIERFSPYTQEEFIWSDPTMNATLGCNYLAYLIKRFGGSVYLALVSYNWGETNLANIKAWEDIPQECLDYADKICANLDKYDENW